MICMYCNIEQMNGVMNVAERGRTARAVKKFDIEGKKREGVRWAAAKTRRKVMDLQDARLTKELLVLIHPHPHTHSLTNHFLFK